MKFILLNKYLVKELAANVQIGKVVSVSRVNDLNRFAIVFKPPLGNLAKKISRLCYTFRTIRQL